MQPSVFVLEGSQCKTINHSQIGKEKWRNRRNYEWLNDYSLRNVIQRPSTEIKLKILKEFDKFLIIYVMEKVLVSHLTTWPILLPQFLTASILWPLEQLLTYSFNDKKAFLSCVKDAQHPICLSIHICLKTKLILICKKFIKSLFLKNVFGNRRNPSSQCLATSGTAKITEKCKRH